MKILITILFSLLLIGCGEGELSKPSPPRKIFSIKVYSANAQLINEYKTYKAPFNTQYDTTALNYSAIRFKNLEDKQFTIMNALIIIEEE